MSRPLRPLEYLLGSANKATQVTVHDRMAAREEYEALLAECDHLRKVLLRISLLRPDEGYGVMDISIFAKNALEGKPC